MPAEAVRERAGDGHGRVGEGGRGGEPVAGGDDEADGVGHCVRLCAQAAHDRRCSRAKVATISPVQTPRPVRTWLEAWISGSPNIRWASEVPAMAPAICTGM